MKLVRDMIEKEKFKIVEALKADGFTNIDIQEPYISFQKGLRQFQLISTDINNKEDMGLRLDFKFDEFMQNNYEHKSRHTVSLSDAVERMGSIDEACEDLGWKVLQVKYLQKQNSGWKAGLHAEEVYELLIGSLKHIVVDGEVYAGELSRLWLMGTTSADELLAGTRLLNVLNEF